MRTLTRATLLGAVVAATVPTAFAGSASAASTLVMTASPNKRGTLTVGRPTTFKVDFKSPDRISMSDGSMRLKNIVTRLPDQLVFNPAPFKMCNTIKFVAEKTCPAATKMGEATIMADAGPDFPALVEAKATLYFGSGYSVLAYVTASRPATIEEAVIGQLQTSSSGTDAATGYGLQLSIPVSPKIQQPLDNVFPTVRSFAATIKPLTKKVKVDRKKVKLPLVGLGVCKKLNFKVAVEYTNADNGPTTTTDSDDYSQKCKR